MLNSLVIIPKPSLKVLATPCMIPAANVNLSAPSFKVFAAFSWANFITCSWAIFGLLLDICL